MRYEFDWDPNKERANLRKHGLSFRQAASVFRDPNQLSVFDVDDSETEDRWITLGIDSTGVLRVIVHTFEQIDENLANKNNLSSKSKSRRNKKVQRDGDMKDHYDFSVAERGKFYRADAEFYFPVYLEPDVNDFLTRLADQKKVAVDELVNELLQADIDIIQSAGS